MFVENLMYALGISSSVILPVVANLIWALFLLLIGLLIARGLRYLTVFVLKAVRLDKGAEQIGFHSLLEKANMKKTASDLVGSLVYWVVALMALIGVAEMFGLPVEPALLYVFSYMGIVLLAALILGIGVFLAGLISAIVRLIMANLGLEGEKLLPRVIYYIIIIFVFLAALAELGFAPDWTPHIGIILGMPALAAAIAFGLGCKDMAADFLSNLFKGK